MHRAMGHTCLRYTPARSAPQHVDWFWQPQSRARKPDDVNVAFDRVALPVIAGDIWRREDEMGPGGPPLPPGTPLADVLTHRIEFFWAMSLVVAKYIARRKVQTVSRMTRVVARTLNGMSELLGTEESSAGRDAALGSSIATADPVEQFDVLDELAREATGLHTDLADRGATIPAEAIDQIRRFYELARSMATP